MPAQMMYGKPVAEAILQRCDQDEARTLGLAIVQVGNRPESESYVKRIGRTAADFHNLVLRHVPLPENAAPCALREVMMDLNDDPSVTGYMVLLPLPPQLQERLAEVRQWIAPAKDVDLLGPEKKGDLFAKTPGQLLPPTPCAVMNMLRVYGVSVRKHVVAVVGAAGHVGKPLTMMLINDGATVLGCDVDTQDIAHWTRQADIVIGATGVPDIIKGDMITEGAVVVNVGMKVVSGTMRGDVHVESVKERAGRVTPVLGGLGPATGAALIQNVYRAACPPMLLPRITKV